MQVSGQISIVFLWAELNGYLEAVMRTLSNKSNAKISIVHWDERRKNSTQHEIKNDGDINFYARSITNNKSIIEILKSANPDIIVVSGWMDKGYIKACLEYRKINKKSRIVAGIDDIWTGSIRQHLGRIFYKFFYKRLFDYMWIAGQPQFSYAQRFGYDIGSIISNLYSADTDTYNLKAAIAKRFIFVGRFVKVKALDILVEAYCMLPEGSQKEWPLILVGDGDQKAVILSRNNPNITVLPFLQPEALRAELLKGGVGCLPSHKDQWGVILHEYALMGLPLLASSGCGATTEFLISGYNGLLFRKSDTNSLFKAMRYFTSLSESDMRLWGANSNKLGQKISTELSAASLLSIYNQHNNEF